MPLTAKGQKIMANMQREYGPDKGERVFYASRNAGRITGVDPGHQDGGWVQPVVRALTQPFPQTIGDIARYYTGDLFFPMERNRPATPPPRPAQPQTLPLMRRPEMRQPLMEYGQRRAAEEGYARGGIITHDQDSDLPGARDDATLIQMMPRTPPAYDATIARLNAAQEQLDARPRRLPPYGWIPMRYWNGGWVVPRYWAGGWVW